MSLIQSKATLAAAGILADMREIKQSYIKDVRHLSSMLQRFISLNNEDLAEFGNMMDPGEMEMLMTLHGQLGYAANQAVASVEQVLSTLERRTPLPVPQVDIRPVPVKLAEQDREMSVDATGTWSIVNIVHPPVLRIGNYWGSAVGDSLSIVLTATNGPVSYTVSGLPAGLVFDGVDTISGVVDTVGEYVLGIDIVNSKYTTSVELYLNVEEPLPPVVIIEEPIVEPLPDIIIEEPIVEEPTP